MNLFVANQVAGAEYILPLLMSWNGKKPFRVFASRVSGEVLKRHGIECEIVGEQDASLSREQVLKYINGLEIDRAILSTSQFSPLERSFLKVLKGKVPTIQFVDYWVNYRERFVNTDGNETLLPDTICTIDDFALAEMVEAGIPREIIRVVGQPHFESHLQRSRTAKSVSNKVLLMSQPVSKFYEMSLGYSEDTFLAEASNALKGFEVHVALHPAESATEVSTKFPALKIVRLQNIELSEYSLVVGMFSSAMVQSLLAGVTTVSFQPRAVGADRCFLSRAGYISRIVDSKDLISRIKNEKAPAQSRGAGDLERSLTGSLKRFENLILNEMKRSNENVETRTLGR